MKHLCCNKLLIIIFLLTASLYASFQKSAVFLYTDNISYTMLGIHDYIVLEPKYIDIYNHGYSLYKNKIYARVIISSNTQKEVEKLLKKGINHFFFDIDDNKNKKIYTKTIKQLLNLYPGIHIIIRADIKESKKLFSFADAIVLYNIYENNNFKQTIKKLKKHTPDIIDIEINDIYSVYGSAYDPSIIKSLSNAGAIPYMTNGDFSIYGKSSKNAIKREILTLVNKQYHDDTLQSAHQIGSMVFEYLGYIQKLYDVNKGLPSLEKMTRYASAVVWINGKFDNAYEIIDWINKLQKIGIKVAYANNFGGNVDPSDLSLLNINIYDSEAPLSKKKKIVYKDKIIGYETQPSPNGDILFLNPKNAKPLLICEDANGLKTTLSAITKWGGYAMIESFLQELDDENLWVINPFEFFKQALRLKPLLVPDVTTQNGKRIFFTHVDGDGAVSTVEYDPEYLSIEMLYKEILTKYKIPHSISIIGAEVLPNGLYPKISKRLLEAAKTIYRLNNVEPATHTFTHTFFWGKIDKNGNLDEKYRLKPKGYKYNLDYEIKGMLDYINKNLNPTHKAKTVFWSGDCAPRYNALSNVYRHHILNINGGDTTISNLHPWLSNIAPLGIERDGYYQIYTGAQNENVFTNDWLGPFWGFKRVVQTFKMTDSPKRFKPIDIYYHIYSGSKKASLKALQYVFDWVLKQDIIPIYTSEYIPKVMDFYEVSMANEGDKWLFEGLRDLKTIRIEKKDAMINLDNSKTVMGIKHYQTHTYLSLDNHQRHIIDLSKPKKDISYLVSANGFVKSYNRGIKNQKYSIKSYVDIKASFYLSKGCKLKAPKKAKIFKKPNNIFDVSLKSKEGDFYVICR